MGQNTRWALRAGIRGAHQPPEAKYQPEVPTCAPTRVPRTITARPPGQRNRRTDCQSVPPKSAHMIAISNEPTTASPGSEPTAACTS